jgi:hypothetical protein
MGNVISPVGRIVQGDLFEGSTNGYQNKPYGLRQDGSVIKKWFIALAIEKNNPDLAKFMQDLLGQARQAWPTFHGNHLDNNVFKSKIADGDATDDQNMKGCVIFKLESQYPPTIFAPDCKRVITNPEEVKRGYYIQVAGSYETNGDNQKPGMKFWLQKVLFKYAGTEIKGSSDGSCFVDASSGYRPAGAVDIAQQGFAPHAVQGQPQGFAPHAVQGQPQGFGVPQANPQQVVPAHNVGFGQSPTTQQNHTSHQIPITQHGVTNATSPSNHVVPDYSFLTPPQR